MRLIIDIDNVICNFVEAMINYTNQQLGTSYKNEDVTVWDFVDSPNINIEYDQMMVFFKEFFDKKLWGTAPIYPDTFEVLDWLVQYHEIIYLTNRPPEAEQSTIDFFELHDLPYFTTHILKSYDDDFIDNGAIVFINGHQKSIVASNMAADIAIEDKPQTIQEYLNAGICVALKIEPYNDWVDYKDPNQILYKCANLTEFKSLVKHLERRRENE